MQKSAFLFRFGRRVPISTHRFWNNAGCGQFLFRSRPASAAGGNASGKASARANRPLRNAEFVQLSQRLSE